MKRSDFLEFAMKVFSQYDPADLGIAENTIEYVHDYRVEAERFAEIVFEQRRGIRESALEAFEELHSVFDFDRDRVIAAADKVNDWLC